MFNKQDTNRNGYMLTGPFAHQGYDWWWHSFTAINEETGEEKPFFIEYYLCNPEHGGVEPVLGQLPENQKWSIRPSYLMVKAGCWGKYHVQLHRFFGWKGIDVKKTGAYRIDAMDCHADDTRLTGSIHITEEESDAHPEWMCDAGDMEWDLQVNKQIAYNVGYGASTPFRAMKAFEMYWHVEGMKSEYEGTITLNGTRYIVLPEKSHGYADKNWGRNFTTPWLWLSSNCMKSRLTGQVLENSVFTIGGGKPKVYCVALDRKLLGGFWYEGQEFEYNFSKFLNHKGTKFHSWETEDEIRWWVCQENRDSLMITRVKCKKEDMLFVNYEGPDGKKRHNHLWNGGNGVGRIRLYRKTQGCLQMIDDIDVTHIGCEYGEYDK